MSPWDMRLCFWAGEARRAGGGGAAAAPQLARRQGRRAGGRSPTRRRPPREAHFASYCTAITRAGAPSPWRKGRGRANKVKGAADS